MRSSMMARLVAWAAILASPVAMASTEYWSPKAAMIEAIEAPAGQVSGILRGQIADQFAATTKSTSPVEIEVTTIKSFSKRDANASMSA